MSTQTVEQQRSITFGVVFGILAVFTILEVVVSYLVTLPQGVKIALLIFLAVVKAALVLLYFMHLRFDSRIFALPFALGLVLVIPISLIVTLTMNTAPRNVSAQAVNEVGQVIDVREVSFNISLSQYTAQAGPVTFHIVNGADDMLHEFIIFETDLPPAELPTDMSGRVMEDAMTILTAAEDIPPSHSRDLTVNMGAGHYVMVCNLPGHYLQGMRVEFTVTGTSNVAPSTPEEPVETPAGTPSAESTATPGS
jgi:caa(3)-type oxidase subunit IV